MDEPIVSLDLEKKFKEKFLSTYNLLSKNSPKILLTSYFSSAYPNYNLWKKINVDGIHFDLVKLKYLCSAKTGNKDTQDRVEDGEYPFYVRSPIIERINSYSFEGESVLAVGDGVGTGKVFHYVNGKFNYHQFFKNNKKKFIIRVKKKILRETKISDKKYITTYKDIKKYFKYFKKLKKIK